MWFHPRKNRGFWRVFNMKGGWELYWYHFVHVVQATSTLFSEPRFKEEGWRTFGEHEAVSTEKLGLVYSTNS